MWQTSRHPDPFGDTLITVQNMLKNRLGRRADGGKLFGIFWDYMSIYQRDDPTNFIFKSMPSFYGSIANSSNVNNKQSRA